MESIFTKIANIVKEQIEDSNSHMNKYFRRIVKSIAKLIGYKYVEINDDDNNNDNYIWQTILESIEKTAKIESESKRYEIYKISSILFKCINIELKNKLLLEFIKYNSENKDKEHLVSKQIDNSVKLKLKKFFPIIELEKDFYYQLEVTPNVKDFNNSLICEFKGESFMEDDIKKKDEIKVEDDIEKKDEIAKKEIYLLLKINDKKEEREIKLEKFPVTFGKADDNDIVIYSEYTSKFHGKIIFENNNFYFIDNSTNGTFINGKKIHNNQEEIKGKEVIIFGGNKKQEYNNYGQITILTIANNDKIIALKSENTPISPISNTPTPISHPTPTAGLVIKTTPIIVKYNIIVKSFDGEKAYDVKNDFPITIGRDIDQKIIIPTDKTADESTGIAIMGDGKKLQRNTVSRKHLEIIAIDEIKNIVKVKTHSSYGTFINGEKQDDEFELPIDSSMELGVDEPLVSIKISKR